MMSKTFKGTHWSKMPNKEEIRQRIKATKKANPTKYWTGKKHTEEEKKKISQTKRDSSKTVRGASHHNWKGGITSEQGKIRGSLQYVIWRNDVYKRDGWSCRVCKKKCLKGNIVAHHIKEFADFPELRFITENGLTLCRKCHLEIHRTYMTHT